MTGFERSEREWRERGKFYLPKSVAHDGDGGQRNQVQEQQSAATQWCRGVDLGTGSVRSIQKTGGYTEFVCADPCATEVSVLRSQETGTVANDHARPQCGLPRQFFIPVAEQLVPVFVVDPAYGAHAGGPQEISAMSKVTSSSGGHSAR